MVLIAGARKSSGCDLAILSTEISPPPPSLQRGRDVEGLRVLDPVGFLDLVPRKTATVPDAQQPVGRAHITRMQTKRYIPLRNIIAHGDLYLKRNKPVCSESMPTNASREYCRHRHVSTGVNATLLAPNSTRARRTMKGLTRHAVFQFRGESARSHRLCRVREVCPGPGTRGRTSVRGRSVPRWVPHCDTPR